MSTRKHIAIVCSSLNLPGGIERAIVNTANLFIKKDHPVTIIIFDETKKSFYPLDEKIRIVQANFNFGLTAKGNVVSRKINFFSQIKSFCKILETINPYLVITTEYVFTITARLASKKTKILSWEHHHFYWLNKSRFWNFLFKKIYPKVDRIICLNNTEKKLFEATGCRTEVIPNFITGLNNKAELQTKTLLTIGWLIKRKGVDLIPNIAEKIFKDHPDWRWKIIGEGEEYPDLKNEINKKNLNQYINIIKPSTYDLSIEYFSASIYVMTSRFECFPMVLLEAMSSGVPPVSFNCLTGPSDIIINNEDGLLVENENVVAITEAIKTLIKDDEKRKAMGNKAYENIKRFSEEVIYNKWKVVFDEV